MKDYGKKVYSDEGMTYYEDNIQSDKNDPFVEAVELGYPMPSWFKTPNFQAKEPDAVQNWLNKARVISENEAALIEDVNSDKLIPALKVIKKYHLISKEQITNSIAAKKDSEAYQRIKNEQDKVDLSYLQGVDPKTIESIINTRGYQYELYVKSGGKFKETKLNTKKTIGK